MKTLVYFSDRWGVDRVNILICDNYEHALNLFMEYHKLKVRFKNLDTPIVEYRQTVIPILSKDLKVSEQELVTYLRDECDMCIEEVNESTY